MRLIHFACGLVLLFCGCLPFPVGSVHGGDGIEEIPPMPMTAPETHQSDESSDSSDSPASAPEESPTEGAEVQTQSKPAVWAYIQHRNCPPCNELKKWEAENRDKLPFVVKFTCDLQLMPIPVKSFPTLHWNTDKGSFYFSGWYGGEHLVKSWESTQ